MKWSILGLATLAAASAACSSSTGIGADAGGEVGLAEGARPVEEAGGEAGAELPTTDSGVDQSTTDVGADQTSVGPDGVGGIDAPADDASTAVDVGADVATVPIPDFLWYVMDETSGTVAHDSSPSRHDIDIPGITWNQGGIFDGMTACGETNVGPGYRSPPVTISAWLQPAARTDMPTGHSLYPYPPNAVSDDIPGVGGYGIGLNVWIYGSALAAEGVSPCTSAGLCVANATQNAAATGAGDGGLSCTGVASCNQGFMPGTEYLVTLTIDAPPHGSTTPMAQVYVNGVLFDLDTAFIPTPNGTPPLYIGCHNYDTAYGTARFFDGRIRDVRIYLRQLAAADVRGLYANGPALHAPLHPDAGASDAGGG